MEPQDTAAAPGGPLITYTRCWDARTFVVRAPLSSADRRHLQHILDQLAALGTVTLARTETVAAEVEGLNAIIAHLRCTLGALIVDAAVAAAAYPATPLVPPQALIPLWDFEPASESADALVAYGLLLGCNLTFEAFRVEDDDDPMPIEAAHALWRAGAGRADTLGTARIPGGTATYAVFAALRAS